MEKQKEECKNQLQKKDCYNDLTVENLEKILNEISEKPKRTIKFLTGCKTFGWTDLSHTCNDPECLSCSNFNKIFLEEVKKITDIECK